MNDSSCRKKKEAPTLLTPGLNRKIKTRTRSTSPRYSRSASRYRTRSFRPKPLAAEASQCLGRFPGHGLLPSSRSTGSCLSFHHKRFVVDGAHSRKDPIQMVVFMLNQFGHIILHLHFLRRPIFVQIAQYTVAMTAHAHKQLWE